MANFVVIIDPDRERRSHFLATIEPLLPLVEGLITDSCATGDFHASWAASPNAPISSVADREGAAVVWGEAIAQGTSERINAKSLRNLWKTPQTLFDGYYGAIVYHPLEGIIVGADLLGTFPVYYYTSGDVALVGSSPELFRHHPLFTPAFNPVGLVGILLTQGLFEGQTLWQDVRRLGAGHLLVWQPTTSPKEVRQYQIPEGDLENKHAHLSFAQQLDKLEQALDQTLARHAPTGTRYSLLLSGGLDSRMLAGFLQRRGIDPVTLTLGLPTDIEMQCAIPVARTLGLEHHPIGIPYKHYPSQALLYAQWEHLASNFNWVMNWGIYSHLRDYAPRAVTGYLMDRVVGGQSTYYLPLESLSFDVFFARGINSCAVSPQLLKRLLRQEVFGDLVQDTLARIRTLYESYCDEEFRRTWWFELYHRQRFHIGSMAWQICFGAWPVLPCLDWHLLETTASLPVDAIANRRAQTELACTRFRKLAKLPLDRNDFYIEPLIAGRIRRKLAPMFRLQWKWRQWLYKQGYDRRYYFRTFDINNPGWKAIRQQAEPYRERVQHLFHQDVLDEILPSPNVRMQFQKNAIDEASGIKALLGFLLWSKDHL
jgi:asparagine synthase (glutamine-hydrolysing)